MKKTNNLVLAVSAILLSTTSLFAQKAKIVEKIINYRYVIYPQFDGYEEIGKYQLNIADFDGGKFKVISNAITKPTDVDPTINMLTGPINSKTFVSTAAPFVVNIVPKRDKSFLSKEVASYKITENGAESTRYTYVFKDVLHFDFEVLNADTVVLKSSYSSDLPYYWGGPIDKGANRGYASKGALENAWRHSEEKDKNLYNAIYARMIESRLLEYFREEPMKGLNHYFSTYLWSGSFTFSSVKTKETTKFQVLDSATIYIDNAFDLTKKNVSVMGKETVKGNAFVPEINAMLRKAHNIYLEYNKDEYINWFTDPALKEEYTVFMLSNLYYTSFMLGEYELCDKIMKKLTPVITQESNKEEKKGLFSNSAAAFKEALSEVKVPKPVRAYNRIERFEELQKREAEQMNQIRQRYGF